MKHLLNFLAITFLSVLFLNANGEEVVNIQYNGRGSHIEHYTPADMPIVYFYSEAMEIIIEAEGYADYYVVEVISMVSGQTLIYTQIDGYGDTIDISALPDAYYQIIITSSNNNVFEGTFLIE